MGRLALCLTSNTMTVPSWQPTASRELCTGWKSRHITYSKTEGVRNTGHGAISTTRARNRVIKNREASPCVHENIPGMKLRGARHGRAKSVGRNVSASFEIQAVALCVPRIEKQSCHEIQTLSNVGGYGTEHTVPIACVRCRRHPPTLGKWL